LYNAPLFKTDVIQIMALSAERIAELALEFAEKEPKYIINYALQEFDNIAVSFSGAEDVLLIELASKVARKLDKTVSVFTLDTGRLHPETYRFIDKVRAHYGIVIDVMHPDADRLETFVREKGLFSFYETDHHECCGIRKTEPLKRKLATLDAWITGQRKDQSPSTRNQVPVIEMDPTFSSPDTPLIKFNPLANWSSKQVWETIRMFDVPYNELHDRGYISIGCEPCTRPVGPNQHEREGRWWWEEATAKECGLHQGNVIASDADGD
jgi:phosphoadenosine phosphosulfate reductase